MSNFEKFYEKNFIWCFLEKVIFFSLDFDLLVSLLIKFQKSF